MSGSKIIFCSKFLATALGHFSKINVELNRLITSLHIIEDFALLHGVTSMVSKSHIGVWYLANARALFTLSSSPVVPSAFHVIQNLNASALLLHWIDLSPVSQLTSQNLSCWKRYEALAEQHLFSKSCFKYKTRQCQKFLHFHSKW